jgi:hypothetical protein
MTEAEWLTCNDPRRMLLVFQEAVVPGDKRFTTGDRQLRLFACACCRTVWPNLTDARSRRAVKVAERYVDGLATAEQLRKAEYDANQAQFKLWRREFLSSSDASEAQGWQISCLAKACVRQDPLTYLRINGYFFKAVPAVTQADLLRDIIGNPFRPVAVDPSWLAWNGGTVVQRAQAIYDERAFDRLPILADALEDADCHDVAILAHCRGPGPHTRGCWVVDHLLGKK